MTEQNWRTWLNENVKTTDESIITTKEFKIEIITGHHGEKVELPIDGIILGATVDTYSNREHYLVRIVLLVPVEEAEA